MLSKRYGDEFYTEKQTEDFLKLEARDFRLPDGSVKAVTAPRLVWLNLDFGKKIYSEEQLVAAICNSMKETGLNFEDQLWHLAAFFGCRLRDFPPIVPHLLPPYRYKPEPPLPSPPVPEIFRPKKPV